MTRSILKQQCALLRFAKTTRLIISEIFAGNVRTCVWKNIKATSTLECTKSGVCRMQTIGIILLLISIGTIVGPVGAVVVMYRDNLAEIVVPPQISDIMNGNTSILGGGNGNGDGSALLGSDQQILAPVYVSAQIDKVSRTFTVTVNFTNTLNYELRLNSLSAGVECSQHNYYLGTIGLNGAIAMPAGQTSQITVSGSWTQDAENHAVSEHASASSINVNLVNLTIDVNGIVIQETEPISVGDVPIT